ncbi:hypothetical protein U1Q18_010825 [Sarracenia purpurea var. burkii]
MESVNNEKTLEMENVQNVKELMRKDVQNLEISNEKELVMESVNNGKTPEMENVQKVKELMKKDVQNLDISVRETLKNWKNGNLVGIENPKNWNKEYVQRWENAEVGECGEELVGEKG